MLTDEWFDALGLFARNGGALAGGTNENNKQVFSDAEQKGTLN